MRQGDEVYYLNGDHLGSTSLTTDNTGAIVSEVRYLPYGQERWTNGVSVTDFGFTSQRNEASFGLMDYNARYYSPLLGRFVSPDTIVPDPTSSGGFNRYRYTRNNPLKYVDPSGHQGCDEEVEDCDSSPDKGFYTELYDNVKETLETLPQDTVEEVREQLQDTAEQIWNGIKPQEIDVPKKRYDTILGRDDIAVVLGADYQIAIPRIEALNFKMGVEMIIHPSGDSLQFTKAATNEMFAAGAGGSYSGALLFNVGDLDEAAMIDQAFSISGAAGGGATFSYLSASSGSTPGGNTPWGVAVGPSVGAKVAAGYETTTSYEIYRYNPVK